MRSSVCPLIENPTPLPRYPAPGAARVRHRVRVRLAVREALRAPREREREARRAGRRRRGQRGRVGVGRGARVLVVREGEDGEGVHGGLGVSG